MTCQRTVEAGAYVLGALPPAQRLDYHQHLVTCAECRAEVADLAALPGLLGRLDAVAASDLDAAQAPPRSLLPAALNRLRQSRRRLRLRFVLGVAVAVLVAAAGTGALAWQAGGTTPAPAAPLAVALAPMQPVQGVSGAVQAQIALVPDGGGTRIEMHCVYLDTEPYENGNPWRLTLLVFPKGGGQPVETVAMWTAKPGDEISVSGSSPLPPDRIDHVALRRGDNIILLTYSVT